MNNRLTEMRATFQSGNGGDLTDPELLLLKRPGTLPHIFLCILNIRYS